MKFAAHLSLLYLFLLLDGFASNTGAVRIQLDGGRVPASEGKAQSGPGLGKRGSLTGVASLKDSGDITYYTNITLGGSSFKVEIDTGSSDLWIAGDVPGAQNTSESATVDYAVGSASGPIMTGTFQFDDYTVDNQAFINVPVDSSHPSGVGLMGLGPNTGSRVYTTLDSSSGDTVLNRIFEQNTSTPNYITFLLGRTTDTLNPYSGELTIGEVLPNYTNITSQPQLDIVEDSSGTNQHWQTRLDANGIIGPDGEAIQVTSVIGDLDQLVVVFDTGYTLPQVPTAVANAIYSRVPGANYTYLSTTSGNIWTVPCNVELNVTFKFGGVSFPINPLDTVTEDFTTTNADGEKVCVGAFQPIQAAASPDYDMILGMGFLRNAYLLVDLGDYVDGSTAYTGAPYMQLLPTTNASQAHLDFVQERLGGVDNTSSFHLLPESVPGTPSVMSTASDSSESLSERVKPYLPYIIAGSIAVGIILIVAAAYCISNSRSKRNAYQRLHEPAPVGLHHEQPPFPRYQRPHRRY